MYLYFIHPSPKKLRTPHRTRMRVMKVIDPKISSWSGSLYRSLVTNYGFIM